MSQILKKEGKDVVYLQKRETRSSTTKKKEESKESMAQRRFKNF
jgi:hypothetical protein